jgi:hypothetical protein
VKFRLGEVFAEAASLWRHERSLILPVAGLFYFVPALALLLLLPDAKPTGEPGSEEALESMLAYARDHAGAILGANLAQLIGAATLLTLFLAAGRPDLREAMRVMLVRLVPFVACALLIGIALTVSALLVVPALYLIGRFFLATAAIASGRANGPIEGITRSFELTRGRGWMFFGFSAIIFFAGQTGISVAAAFDHAATQAGGGSAVLHLIFNGVAALAGTAAWIATLLVKVVVYRRLTSGT